MKRFWTIPLVVAVAIVMALPAGAVKPVNPGKPPPDEPLVGLTCAEAAAEYGFDNVDAEWSIDEAGKTTFTVELGIRQDACVDVMSVQGDWRVDVDMGTALEVSMGVQDSVAPGDACWGGCAGGGSFTANATDVPFFTPESILDACDFDLMDPDFGDSDPALTFSASAAFRGDPKKATPATITVTLP